MTERIRFHLDENVNSAITAALRRIGADVSTTASAGLIGSSDLAQLAFIQSEGRVLVTHDDDFLTIANTRDDHGKKFMAISIGNLPFFTFFAVADQYIAARGRGGGLAIWVK
jgi:predicted nuclease of predicted toxin-antitoxin system